MCTAGGHLTQNNKIIQTRYGSKSVKAAQETQRTLCPNPAQINCMKYAPYGDVANLNFVTYVQFQYFFIIFQFLRSNSLINIYHVRTYTEHVAV